MAKKKRKSGRQRRPRSRQRASGRFTAEDKAKILEEVDRGEELQVDIAARHGIHAVTLSRWKKARDEARRKREELGGGTHRGSQGSSRGRPVP